MKFEQREKNVLSVYYNKSFTKAAAELGVSQPALSASINKLENELGIRIFERKKSPISPTEEGRVYIEYLKKFRLDYRECFSKINDIMDNRNRTITIGAPVAYANTFIPDKVAEFNEQYPECKIAIKEAALSRLVEMAADGEIDCFISTSSDLESNYVTELIKQEKIYLCIPKDWDINNKLTEYQINIDSSGFDTENDCPIIEDWTLLSGTKPLNLADKPPLQKTVVEFLRKENVISDNSITVNQVLLGVNLASRGMGMMFSSEAAIRGSNNQYKLCIYALPEYIASRPIFIAYNGDAYLPRMCRLFMDMLKKQL